MRCMTRSNVLAQVLPVVLVTAAHAAGVSDPAAPSDTATYARMDLAAQYLAARSDIRGSITYATGAGGGPPLSDPHALEKIKEALLREARHGPNWGPENPEWKRMAALIDQDMPQIQSELAPTKDPALLKRIDEAVIGSLARHLSTDQLEALIHFYSTSPGKQFATTQRQMLNDVWAGYGKALMADLRGQKTRSTDNPTEEELKEMAGLVAEYGEIHLGLTDPGPDADRSGRAAIPMVFAAGIRADFPLLRDRWQSIPEADRKAILAWRDAPLFRAECDALGEAARDIRRVSDPAAPARHYLQVMEKYKRKWAAQMSR